MEKIDIIQGDTTHIIVDFEEDKTLVKSFVFCSKSLKLAKKVTALDDNGDWSIDLSSEETKNLNPMTTTFDITVIFNQDEIVTGVYCGIIQVYPKINDCEDIL